jgi:hypothetical protein
VYDVRRGKPDFEESGAGDASARDRGSLMPVAIVLGSGLALIVGLVALTGLAGLYVVLALGGVLSFAALHYVLWGWWLTGKIQRERDAEDADD